MKRLKSISILAERFSFVPALTAVTLLGGAIGSESFHWRLGIAFLSNFLIYTFALFYQKIETAPAAAANPNTISPNPIASGEVTVQAARTLAALTALLALASATVVGVFNAAIAVLGVLFAISLSHHNLRLGSSAIMRLGKYQPLLSVLFGLSGFLASKGELNFVAILLAVFLLAVGILFAALTAEGSRRLLSRTMLVILVVAASAAAYELFFVFEALNAWVLSLLMLLGGALALLRHRYSANRQTLRQTVFDALTLSTSLSLIISFLVRALS